MPVLCLRKLRWPGSLRDGLGIKGSGSNFNQGHCMMFFGETNVSHQRGKFSRRPDQIFG